jgi:hypothetical protein
VDDVGGWRSVPHCDGVTGRGAFVRQPRESAVVVQFVVDAGQRENELAGIIDVDDALDLVRIRVQQLRVTALSGTFRWSALVRRSRSWSSDTRRVPSLNRYSWTTCTSVDGSTMSPMPGMMPHGNVSVMLPCAMSPAAAHFIVAVLDVSSTMRGSRSLAGYTRPRPRQTWQSRAA